MQFSDPVYILRTPWCAKPNLNIQWLAIPQYLRIISLTFILTGIIEFICSQVPYSMKGIMMGAQYTLVTICSVPIVGVFMVLLEKDLSILGERTISSAFWYALLMIAAYPFLFLILACMTKRYKMRKREALLPNKHFIAERYCSQLINNITTSID